MDGYRFASLARDLTQAPSRRAVGHALLGLMAGSVLAPLLGLAGAEAKKKKGHKKKIKNKKEWICKGLGYVYCPGVGEPNDCCWQDRDYPAICTACGCCSAGESCCLGGVDRACCAADETCCQGPNGEAYCCGPDEMCCGGACVPKDYQSCGGVYCCHPFLTCCPDNRSCCFNPLNCPCSA